MQFLAADHPEWGDMWEVLANHPLNAGSALCLHDGKAWEYMGSTDDHHHMRHSNHPSTGEVEYVYVERRCAALDWAKVS